MKHNEISAHGESNPVFEPAKLEMKALHVPFPEKFIYSNASAFSTSFMDIRIGFAEAGPGGNITPGVGIVMPPEHAAHVALNLLAQLEFFETHFGEIRHAGWRSFREKAIDYKLPSASDSEPDDPESQAYPID